MNFFTRIISLSLLLGLSSCLGTKYLKENERLLVEQNIKGNKTISNGELEEFYRQQPNLRLPLIPWAPYVSIYYLGTRFYDKDKIRRKRDEQAEKFDRKIARAEEKGRDTRAERLRDKRRSNIEKKEKVLDEGNLLMRMGEPITVFDSTLSQESARQMELYLHSKGFYHGEVTYDFKLEEEKARVTYLVDEKLPFIIDTVFLTVANNKIREIIVESNEDSYLDTTQRYDQANLTQERSRIDALLKNNGYFEFSPQYVEFNVDTTLGDRKVSIETVIYRPANRGYHKQFRIDSVIYTTDATTRGDLAGRQSEVYNNIIYRFFEDEYSKRVLDKRVFLRPDSLYSRERTLETQKQLANLDIFKFINITYDTTGDQFNARIFTSPLKKFQTSNEVGFTYSQGIPGPFFTSTWTNRNTFGGLEILELNLRAGVEGVPGTTDPNAAYASQQLAANLSLIFPQFIAPIGPRLRYRIGRLNPKTRLLIGGAYTNRPEFIRSTVNTSVTYTWQTEKRKRENVYNNLYNFSPLDVSLIDSEFKTNVEGNAYLDSLNSWNARGNPLIRTFDPSFVSSMYFFVVLNKNNYGTYTSKSRFIRPFIESGGTTQNFIDLPFAEQYGEEVASGNLRGFRYVKLSNDYRQYFPLNDKTGLAWRLNTGAAVPYGSDNATLPYEKFFFVGGSNSIRAFRPRRLGPGVYNPNPGADSLINTNLIEQPGEVILEGSFEHRHNIFSFLNGAWFLDFGNTWRIKESEAFPGGQFKINEFYKQIALGTGYGFRLDFSFLIIRLDFGVKLYNPQDVTLLDNGRFDYSTGWVFDKLDNFKLFNNDLIVLNIGIGYPF